MTAPDHSGLLLLWDQPRGCTGSTVGGHAVWQGPEPHSPAHLGSEPVVWSHLHAQAGPLRRLLPRPPPHRGHPNAGCGLSGGPWGGPARRAPTHTAHGLDGESTVFLQRHQNCGGPHQSARLPLLGPTTASLGTGCRHPASTGRSALHHYPNTHVFATISTLGSSTTPTDPATPSSSTISLR